MKIEHAFHGSGPLCWCGAPERFHRVRAYHRPEGDPCIICALPASKHLSETALAKRRKRDDKRTRRGDRLIIGIDGEGHDLPDGRHIYTLLSAVDERGRVVAEVENLEGLSTLECVDMLASLPRHALKFVFMGSYDWTKIVEDLNLTDIYYIMHPEARRVKVCIRCKATWSSATKMCDVCGCDKLRAIQRLRKVSHDKLGNHVSTAFDWFNGSFTVAQAKRRAKVWDCFKFFQCSFVKAIKLWKIGTEEQWARIEGMKAKRGAFDVEDPVEIRAYCREECMLLAQMMREVLGACEAAGIRLRQYHGAGSIASALLKANKVKEHLGPPLESMPLQLQHAVMSAYFGGRFENSCVGAVTEPVFNRDIFSAYPYALARLPCLACGVWSRAFSSNRKSSSNVVTARPARTMSRHNAVLKKARAATLAVVRFRVKKQTVLQRKDIAWAPLPCRQEDGSICFPTGFEGWAWLPELEAALRGWPELVEVLEAWTYTTKCDHKPFGWIPDAYRKRFQWGKDGRGIVMKLGLNACAGKTMQNQGDPPPFKSWILGGMITATTRSQSLDAIVAAEDRWNVLGIATDGVFATEELPLPAADDTGTGDLEKPLGNWGQEEHESGVFFVKPGMYFDQAKTLVQEHDFAGKGQLCQKCNEPKNQHRTVMRARGIGRSELNKTAYKLAHAFDDWDRVSKLQLKVSSRRFYGARSSVMMFSNCLACEKTWPGWPEKGCPECGLLGIGRAQHMHLPDGETPAYGRWFPRQIVIEFASLPKREFIAQEGSSGRMRIRDLDGIQSLPYNPGKTTPEGEAARLANLEAMEEPDWDDFDSEEVA